MVPVLPWLVLAVAFTQAVPARSPSPSASARARFERAACPAEVAPGERIDCGVLVVPENRTRTGGRTIRLPVMIFRSRSATPALDPVVFVPGGPGGSAVAGRRSARGNPLLEDRDFIVLEPRGARAAEPPLECPGIDRLKGEIAAGRLRGSAERAALASEARACREKLASSGIDLDGYRTEELADDIEDLRLALGYGKWNLLAVSYGTRVVLTVLRRHPGGVRSVVLDSVLPPDVNFDEVAAANIRRALNAVFDGCAVDRDCGEAYPDLRQRFSELVGRADLTPLSLRLARDATGGQGAEIRGTEVVRALYAALHDPKTIPGIPRVIADAAAGRYEELTALVEGNQDASSMSWGLRYSVWCADEMPFENPERIAAQRSPAMGLGGVDEATAPPEVCRAWNVTPAPAVESTPVRSDVPALVFAGEFDPDTPPDWGRQLLETMPGAVFVELRGRSHAASFSRCGGEITAAFLRAPTSRLPVECALKERGADFGLASRVGR